MIKLYFSYNEKFALTGYTTVKECFSSTESMGEVELTEEEYEEITRYTPMLIQYYPNEEKVRFSEELQVDMKLNHMERLAVAEEEKVRELSTLMARNGESQHLEQENRELKEKVVALEERLANLEALLINT